jgi:hypothetical protein
MEKMTQNPQIFRNVFFFLNSQIFMIEVPVGSQET